LPVAARVLYDLAVIGQAAGQKHLHVPAQLRHVANGLANAGVQAFGRRARGFNLECHAVVGHRAGHDQARLHDVGKSLDDFGDLARVHEHAAHLGGLVGAPHPALDARVGAARWGRAGQHGRQVAGAKADERVVGVERGDHQFPTSPSGTGSPVPGRTISTITPSSSTRPSRAEVS
jgi:hypothetical protein